jgi:hypothetical protein
MHWTVAGYNAFIALHCAKLCGRFQDYWERDLFVMPPDPSLYRRAPE